MSIQDQKIGMKIPTEIRFWLIKLIAGSAMIVLNARLDIVERSPDEEAGKVGDIDCGLIQNCGLPCRDGKIVKIEQMPK